MSVAAPPLIEARSLSRHFHIGGGLLRRSRVLHAVDRVDLDVERGQVLALVGESGSGKTTLGRCLLGMLQPTSGSVHFDGEDMAGADRERRAGFRRRVQPIFQNPYSSLDPRWPVARTVREPLDAFRVGNRAAREQRVVELLDSVGLSQRHARSRPHELSGGQRQRVAIAAALALNPDLIVADEPVSALDVLVQAQILNLVCDLQRELGLTLVFITHDMAVVEHIADRVAVMYLGRIVESGPASEVLTRPQHPYTRTVLDAIPQPDPGRRRQAMVVRGEIPSPLEPPPGCHFHPRCPLAIDRCRTTAPAMTEFGAGHRASCHVTAAQHQSKGA
jgi:oligopeptide transport system ATP-binding protein